MRENNNKKYNDCFNGWSYIKILGIGGQGYVYQVCKHDTECDYALKIIISKEEAELSIFLTVSGVNMDGYYNE